MAYVFEEPNNKAKRELLEKICKAYLIMSSIQNIPERTVEALRACK